MNSFNSGCIPLLNHHLEIVAHWVGPPGRLQPNGPETHLDMDGCMAPIKIEPWKLDLCIQLHAYYADKSASFWTYICWDPHCKSIAHISQDCLQKVVTSGVSCIFLYPCPLSWHPGVTAGSWLRSAWTNNMLRGPMPTILRNNKW